MLCCMNGLKYGAIDLKILRLKRPVLYTYLKAAVYEPRDLCVHKFSGK